MNMEEAREPRWVPAVKQRMSELSLIQQDLCECLGVATRGAVGHYFNGRRDLSIAQAESLCALLGLHGDVFISSAMVSGLSERFSKNSELFTTDQVESALHAMSQADRKKLLSLFLC